MPRSTIEIRGTVEKKLSHQEHQVPPENHEGPMRYSALLFLVLGGYLVLGEKAFS
jgi:hypothetical protein